MQAFQLSNCRDPNFSSMCIENKEKDKVISRLKANIYELEQQEKDYESLKQKFRQLQTDYSLLNEAKLRIEFDLKQSKENFSAQLCELRNDNETLNQTLTEKLTCNKKLYADNETLAKQLDLKTQENLELISKLNELSATLEKTTEDNANLEKVVQSLNDLKTSQKIEITKLIEDNKKLSHICQEQERNLKVDDAEISKLKDKINENNYDICQLNSKIHNQEDSILCLNNQLDNAKCLNLKFQNKVQDLEHKNDALLNDNDLLKATLIKEQTLRADKEKQNNLLNDELNNKFIDLKNMQKDLEQIKALHMKVSEERTGCEMENQKLRDHIILLTNQNQKLANEIEGVVEEDGRIQMVLARKDKLLNVLRNNKISLEQSLSALDQFLSKNNPQSFSTYKKVEKIENSEKKEIKNEQDNQI